MPPDRREEARRLMLQDIAAITAETARDTGRAQLSTRTMEAMARVPREQFVASGDEGVAYRNSPLAIGSGQTISQPFIVALMTDLLELTPQDRVLEIGTGSGYQAAVLAVLAREIYTIEIVETLARSAAQRLAAGGYRNVHTRVGDGYAGWPDAAPFDAIIVTAAARNVPPALLEQLRNGGRLVIPIGETNGTQMLRVLRKTADGTVTSRDALPVRFVPFTGAAQKRE